VHCHELFEERFYAVLPERHPLARRNRVTLTELNRGPFPVLKEGHGFRDGLISACNEPRVEPAVALEGGEFRNDSRDGAGGNGSLGSSRVGGEAACGLPIRPHLQTGLAARVAAL